MKLLSVAIPCYNSADYMEHCIQSLLAGGEEVEILIVDDGSAKDNTAKIADSYAENYPSIVRAIHQENAGHGGAVNTGLANASGVYFKVVDSDDWVDEDAYLRLLDVMRDSINEGWELDMLLSNYVYDKQGVTNKMVMQYRRLLPAGRLFTWDEIHKFPIGKYILMHSVIYRTQLLRDCGLQLPKHTFYVDNIFVFQPFPYVKNMYYLNVDFYHYFIGREDQSVNEKVMISRIDQQLKVNRLMIDCYTQSAGDIGSDKLDHYMLSYLNIITTISSVLCIRSGLEENLVKKDAVWNYLKKKNPAVYKKFMHSPLGIALHLPGKAGRQIVSWGYMLAQKLYGFN